MQKSFTFEDPRKYGCKNSKNILAKTTRRLWGGNDFKHFGRPLKTRGAGRSCAPPANPRQGGLSVCKGGCWAKRGGMGWGEQNKMCLLHNSANFDPPQAKIKKIELRWMHSPLDRGNIKNHYALWQKSHKRWRIRGEVWVSRLPGSSCSHVAGSLMKNYTTQPKIQEQSRVWIIPYDENEHVKVPMHSNVPKHNSIQPLRGVSWTSRVKGRGRGPGK